MSVAILTGAGASEPLGLPVMASMLDSDFRNEATEPGVERAVYDIAANWSAANSESDDIDFELLYTVVDHLSDMALTDLKAVPFAPHQGGPGLYYQDGTGTRMKLGPKKVRRAARDLREVLEARVHELMGGIDAQKAADLYLPLLKTVHASRPAGTPGEASTGEIFVFTTNYDRAVEVPFWQNLVTDTYELVDAFSQNGAGPPVFDADEYERSPETGEVLVKLYKLHGSLHWHRQGNRILGSAGDEYVERNALIYPLQNQKDDLPYPFGELLHRFQEALEQRIGTLLVIGSSFRDRHIRERVVTTLKSDSALRRIILCDPHAVELADSFVDVGISEERIVILERKFGKEETYEAINEALVSST